MSDQQQHHNTDIHQHVLHGISTNATVITASDLARPRLYVPFDRLDLAELLSGHPRTLIPDFILASMPH